MASHITHQGPRHSEHTQAELSGSAHLMLPNSTQLFGFAPCVCVCVSRHMFKCIVKQMLFGVNIVLEADLL